MSTCPFCSKEISEELTLYGGHCPHCLIEIPGEESVTDPGVAVEEDKAETRTTGRKWMLGLAAAVCLTAGWWWTQDGASTSGGGFRGARPAVPLSAHQDQQYENEKAKEEVKTEPKQARRSRRGATRANSAPAAKVKTPTTGSADASDSVAAGLGSAPADMFSAIGAAPRLRGGPQGIVLEDAVKIEEMVARVLIRGSRDVQSCFDTAKKTNPSATGGWYVGFTVSKEGRPVDIGIERLGAANVSVERCIKDSVSSLRFQRVVEQVHVSDTYRMGN